MLRLLPLLAALCALALPSVASASPYLPPHGKIWHGVTGGYTAGNFEKRTGKHPAVWQHFIKWGGNYQYTLENSRRAGARVMLHLSTASGQHAPEKWSPGQLARGRGDRWLINLTRDLAALDQPVYVRLMGEMNNCDNAYSSHNCSGGRRNADHSPARFKQAWKRTVLIMRGGPVDQINARLRALHLRPVDARARQVPKLAVAFVWAPMTGGSPMISALRPQVFWPGSKWVDWVGTSFYSRFPAFHYLEPYYRQFAVRYNKPFALAEWAMWGSDNPSFVRQLFSWVRSHKRVRMMQYNQGSRSDSPFALHRYPSAIRELRRQLRSKRFEGWAPELKATINRP